MNKIKEYFKKKQEEKEMKFIDNLLFHFEDTCEKYPGLKAMLMPITLRIWLDDKDREEKKDFCIALMRSIGYEVREKEEVE